MANIPLFYAVDPNEIVEALNDLVNDINAVIEPDVLTLTGAVNVYDFGAVGNGIADDTAAVQAAIDTGQAVNFARGDTGHNAFFSGGIFACNNLTQSVSGQVLFSSGSLSTIVKNANGPIITCTGGNVNIMNIRFAGDASTPVFTGDNVVATGVNFAMWNCGSRYAYGRAVKSTASHTQIIGTCDIYQTADATASGYDIEIGKSGTATLYHQLVGIYSSQHSGGVLLIDTGSHVLYGGQYGRVYIQKGTGPAGTNGGVTFGGRIGTGATVCEVSNAIFVGNLFDGDVTFAAGTSGCSLDRSNKFQSGLVLTNNGNANNTIERDISTGSYNTIQFGGDASSAIMRISPTSPGTFLFSALSVKNNAGIVFRNAADSGNDGTILFSVAGALSINNSNSGQPVTIQTVGSTSSARIQLAANGVAQMWVYVGAGAAMQAARLQDAQGASVAATNTMTLGTDGNYFQITGATQINTLSNVSWQGGAVVTMKFNSNPVVKHNQAPSGVQVPIILNGAVDFSTAASNTLTLRYDSTDSCWYEIGRKV